MGDLDYIAAALHGRRGRLAAGPRLAALCALGTPRALGEALFPGEGLAAAPALAARLEAALAAEAEALSAALGGARGRFAAWQAAGFGLENLKVKLRRQAAGRSGGGTAAAFAASLPEEVFRRALQAALAAGPYDAFAAEARLDRAYIAELYGRCEALGGEDREAAGEICALESDLYNFRLVLHGRFSRGLSPEELSGLLVPGPQRRSYVKMAAAADTGEIARLAAGLALDRGARGDEPAALEAQALRRYARGAERIFRRRHMTFGAAAAWLALKRSELLSLSALAEGLRLGAGQAELARRLAPETEAAVV